MDKRVTILHVAERAGVVPSTVSRVLNNYPDVSEETRARVLEAVEALGFRPNQSARGLRRGRTDSVSVLLPRVDADFYARLVTAIDAALERHHLTLALYPLLTEERLARYRQEDAPPYQADALLLVSMDPDKLYGGPPPTRAPIVLLDATNPRYDSVTVDNTRGGYLAAQHLLERPSEVYVLLVEEFFSTPFASGVFQQRLEGFRQGLHEAGRVLEDGNVITTEFSWGGGRVAARQILERGRAPVSIFATCDLMARGVIDEATALGLKVGEDVRVIGFDNQPWAEELELSTVHQPVEELGEAAVELLLQRMKNPSLPPRHVQYTPSLVRRASTLGR